MEQDEARVSVGLPVIGLADDKTAGYEIIKTELESAGLVVDDKAAGTIRESLEHQILEFILKVASVSSALCDCWCHAGWQRANQSCGSRGDEDCYGQAGN